MTVAVIIPALNEEDTITAVLRAIPRDLVERVIVVDNGSTDATPQIAETEGAEVVFEAKRGYGSACWRGVVAANGADIVVFMDADGADDPEQIRDLAAPILVDEADLVIGSRERGNAEPGALLPHARFGNWLAAQMMRVLYGLRVTDLGPFRAIKGDVLQALNMQDRAYGWPTEMMVKAAKYDYRVLEIPVDYHKRAGGKSKISGSIRGTFLAAYYIIGTTLKYAWTD